MGKAMKLLTLEEWDAETFSKPHSLNTLRGWARSGLIQPKPIKVGREYQVEPGAKYVEKSIKTTSKDPVVQAIFKDRYNGKAA